MIIAFSDASSRQTPPAGPRRYAALYRQILLPAHCIIRRRSTLRWYAVSSRQQTLSPDELAALQRTKLVALVRHCGARVPHYRHLFRAHGVEPTCVEDLAVLRDAGISTGKQDIRAAGDSLLADAPDRPRLYRIPTSGSTGLPTMLYRSMDTVGRQQALKFRAEEWIGKLIGTRTTLIWGRLPPRTIPRRLGRLLYWRFQNYQFLSAFDIAPEQLARYLVRIASFGSEFLESYVTAVHEMAKVMAARKIAPPPTLRGILVGAEQLAEEQRQFIEASFGCPVYNRYGSTEFSNIASECAERRGLHINADHLLVEVVDEHDRPVVDEVGEIVVTDLDNYDMPLIRYRIGDRGILSTARCPCGRTLPMLRSINGRVSDQLITPSGRAFHDLFFNHALSRVPGVARFQVVQKSLDLLQLNLQLEGTASGEATAAHARAALHTLADHGITLAIQIVDTIPLTAAGKLRHFISELPSR